MGRKLFCEYGPIAYKISLFKEARKKDLRDFKQGRKFAKKKSKDNFEYIWKGDAKVLLRKLYGVDMELQKNKVKKEIEEIDEKISNQYNKIKEEVGMLNKLKTAIISKENKVELLSDDVFSYYDLLTFLKNGIIFKKVSVHKFGADITYIYDNEGNYVLENKDDESPQFATYLSENSSDNTKFERNITVIEE